jgi:protein phosphatase
MGGRNAGALASKVVVTALPQMLEAKLAKARSRSAIARAMRDSIVELSGRIHAEASGRVGLSGMGATVVVALFHATQVCIAHMGDSRAYLHRGGRLTRLTQDHSVVELLIQEGVITKEEAGTHPSRGVLSRYVGIDGVVYPDVDFIEAEPSDRLLLCSDGLTGMVEDETIAYLMNQYVDEAEAVRALVDAANEAGGKDNVTCVVVRARG